MKKTFRRILSALLVAVMLVGVAPMGGKADKAKAGYISDISDNNMLEAFAEKLGINKESIIDYVYDDFNNDLEYEMYVLVGTKSDESCQGKLYFANSYNIQLVRTSEQYSGKEYNVFKVFTVCSRKFIMLNRIPGNYFVTDVYTVIDGNSIETNISKLNYGKKTKFDENTLSLSVTDFDGFTDLNGGNTTRTEKQYYFYWDEAKKMFVEYGGIAVSREQVSQISGMETILNKIDQLKYSIQNMWYRENGVLNINCKIKNNNGYNNENINLKYNYQNKEFELLENYDWKANELLNSSFGGIYESSVTDSVSLPKKFLDLKNWYLIEKSSNMELYKEVLNQYTLLWNLYDKIKTSEYRLGYHPFLEFGYCNELVCYSVYDAIVYSKDYKIWYSFCDIDGNGIDELIVSSNENDLNKIYGTDKGSIINAIYTFHNGKIYLLAEASYRSLMRIHDNGIISIYGSGGVGRHSLNFYSLYFNQKELTELCCISKDVDNEDNEKISYYINDKLASFKEADEKCLQYTDKGLNDYFKSKVHSLSWYQVNNEKKTFNENSYIADIWLSRNREKTPENKAIDSMLSQQSTSATIYDDLKSNKDFQEAVFLWTGMKTVFDPEKGIKDIFLSEEDLYEALIFDLVGKIMYGKNEETGNVIIDAANKASSAVGTVTKYKSYIDKIKTITTVPEKNLLEILKEWKFDPKSESFSKFYGMLSDADQTASKWTDNKFIEGIGTIADVSSDVTDFYKRLTSYIMLEDMSEDTVTLLKTLKSQTQNEKFKTALQNAINAYYNVDTVALVCTMKLTGDITLDVTGAFFDDLSKCSKLYTALRAGYKVGTALCDITMNTSKTVDAYKTCGATKEFINANKAAINVLAEKYLKSISNSDAGAYVTAVRAYQYAYEIDMKNAVSFVKKASDEGLVNKAKKLSVHAFNFFFNKDKQTSYESMVDSEKNILNGMELTFSTLNNTWKFNKDYLYTDYPDVYPVYVKKEISQKQYAPNIDSLYIDKSGKTMLTWSIPLVFKGDDGEVLTLWGASTFDGVYATEKAGGITTKYDKAISGTSNTIEMYNKSTFGSFDKSYTLSSYANSNSGKIYSAAREASLSNPILKPEIRIASAYESGNAQVMFSIVDETSSRYDSLRYLIYRKTGNGAWEKIDEISRENTRFNGRLTLYKDTTAKKGEKYSYKVVSNMVFDNGIALKSPESETVSVIGGLGIKKVNVNIRKNVPQVRTRSVDEEKYGIELSWEKVNSAVGYEIYRVSSYGTVYKLLDTVGSNVTSYTDYDADQGATYSHVVCPYSNSNGKIYDLTEISQGEIEYKVAEIHSVSVSDITLNYKKSTTLKPTITADEGAEYTVKFSSSNPSVARVDENGKVYAAKKGSATITCTVTDSNGNTVTDTCNVNVKYSFGQWLIVIILFGWIWY